MAMKVLGSFFLVLLCLCAHAQTGIIKGQVTQSLTREPIAFATVQIPGLNRGTTTDTLGNFTLAGLEPGLYDLQVSYLGYRTQVIAEIQVTNAKPALINVAMQASEVELDEVVINPEAFKKPVESPLSLRTIGVAEIQRNPGANRDISRVVQSLPGVTSTASFRNDLIIRGGAPNENRFFLDDVEVPNINHFATQGASGGPVGLINVNFIREVDFYSGAFPANRGNALSSVFTFRQRPGRDDRLGATFMLGASDAGLTFEGPLGDQGNFLFSVRRSYLGLLFKVLELPFLPTYTDFQTKVSVNLSPKDQLYFIGLGALDEFELNLDANDTEEQQYLLDNLPETPQWNYTNGLVYKHYGNQGYWTFVLSRNMLNNEAIKYTRNDKSSEENKVLDYRSQEIENKLRIEYNSRVGAFDYNVGVGTEYVKYNNRTFNRIFTSAGPQTIEFASDFNMVKYYAFGQISRKWLGERLALSLGLRVDGNSYSEDMQNPLEQLSPRFSLSYAFTDRFSFNFNAGIYHQLPPYTLMGYQEDEHLVNRDNGLKFITASHLVGGFAYNTPGNAKISVEAYYKHYEDYPFLLRDSISLANLGGDFGVIGNEPARSLSQGRSLGLEVLVQQRLYKGFYGILAYTLGKSEFQDKNGSYVPSSWDSRHIVNLTLGKKFLKGWAKDIEIGINWRYQSGLPYTPFSDASSLIQNWVVNARGIPDYDRLNTERTTAINSLDFRIDKKWFFKNWSLNLYFDLENLNGNAVAVPVLILDRPLDETGRPTGGGVIENPMAPTGEQRFKVKNLAPATGTILPSLGIMVEL